MVEAEEKLILKPEVIKKFLSNYDYTPDRESMQYLNLIMSGKRIEALNNSLVERKHIQFLDLSNNKVADVTIVQ